jgi:hypothetical protein
VRASVEEGEVGVAVELDVRVQVTACLHNVARRHISGIANHSLAALRLRTAPKETCEGSGISRKAGAGASEAVRRGHFFF